MKHKHHPIAYRASIAHFVDDPKVAGDAAVEYYTDGILVIDEGKVVALGDAETLLGSLDHPTSLVDYSGRLIMPGMIDTHAHFPQAEIIGSYGEQLLDWLQYYTFPAEEKFADKSYASHIAQLFLDELLRHGTTTAMVYGSVHATSVDAFFSAAHARNMRMICGKVMMDRHAPPALCDTPESAYQDSRELIERWHGKGRQHYAITPRFAITSSCEQLALAGQLHSEYPDTYLQTHLAENMAEVAQVRTLFPNAHDYLEVYQSHGLLTPHSVFAHGIYLSEHEHKRLQESGASIAFCPSSNMFLGSGLLNLETLQQAGVTVSIASDVGAGTSLSMLRTLSDAYKVCQLQNQNLSALQSIYQATLGNAKSLQLDDRIGSFKHGNEADFIVLDLEATPLMRLRQQQSQSLEQQFAGLITQGDDRAIYASYIAGKPAHFRDANQARD